MARPGTKACCCVNVESSLRKEACLAASIQRDTDADITDMISWLSGQALLTDVPKSMVEL